MNAKDKHLIKEALRKARYLKSKEKGKKTNLTRDEMEAVRKGKMAFMEFIQEKPKENWKPKTKEISKIGDILGRNK